ncbi:MAG: FeoB-associated Cys-rich membrane protein [Candidatus Metalachnospira sp.]|nr:FeoB-associated Cys-rich membrane protein [Candidatus Metalachnospira sp.]
MNIFDWIIIVLVVLCLFFAIRYMIKHKGGCCGGSCSSCSGNCSECRKKNKE